MTAAAAHGGRRGYPASVDEQIQVARFDELDARAAYALWRLREGVFVVEQQCPYPELDGRDLEPGTRHVWLDGRDGPVAYLRVLEEGGTARIGRVLVAAGHRGQGLAGRLMRRALELIGERESELEAQAYLQGWYERFGYAATGPEYLEDGIPHVPMRRSVT